MKESNKASKELIAGFPAYFRIELSWAKFAGLAALLAPMVPARVKEWPTLGLPSR